MRLLQDVGELVGGAQVVGAVPDLVGVVRLVAEVRTGLQDIFTFLVDSWIRQIGNALSMLHLGSVPPRLLQLRLGRGAVVLAAQSQLYHVPEAMLLPESRRLRSELVLIELNLVLVAHPPLHRPIPCLDQANRHLLFADISHCLNDLGLLAGYDLRPEHCLHQHPAIVLALRLDLGGRRLLAIPLVDELHLGLHRLHSGARIRVLRGLLCLLDALLFLVVLLDLHQIDGLVIGGVRRGGARLDYLLWGQRAVLAFGVGVLAFRIAMGEM